MSPPKSTPLALRLRVLWYRFGRGMTPTQATFRATQDFERLAAATAGPVAIDRCHCVCGQLLLASARTCHTCGRRQLMPHTLRQAGRSIRELIPLEHPAAALVLGLILLGYTIQLVSPGGGILRGATLLQNLDLGASVMSLTTGPQPFRAITYAFLHGGLMHLIMNLMTLAQIAPLIEGYFGSARFLLGWVVTGAAGVLLPPLVLSNQNGITLGASGAICGLIGMGWLAAARLKTPQALEVRRTMERWMIYTTIMGLALEYGAGVRVAHGAHFGGAIAGVVLALVIPPPVTPGRKRVTPLVGLLAVAILVAGLASWIAWRQGGLTIPETRDDMDDFWRYLRAHPPENMR